MDPAACTLDCLPSAFFFTASQVEQEVQAKSTPPPFFPGSQVEQEVKAMPELLNTILDAKLASLRSDLAAVMTQQLRKAGL